MEFKIEKNIPCEDSDACAENIRKKFAELLGTEDQYQFHVSISHNHPLGTDKHLIWLFCYNKKGVHESASVKTKEIRYRKDENIKKFTGTMPTLDQLKKALK